MGLFAGLGFEILELLSCQQQQDGNSCGLFTIAFAMDYAMNLPLSGYDAGLMRNQLVQMLQTRNVRSVSEL